MANGDIFKEIKKVIENDPTSLSPDARDVLILSGLAELYDTIERRPKIDTGKLAQLDRHQRVLFGDETTKSKGLVQEVSEIVAFINGLKEDIRKAIWFVVAPVLGVLGVGIIVIITLGIQVGK